MSILLLIENIVLFLFLWFLSIIFPLLAITLSLILFIKSYYSLILSILLIIPYLIPFLNFIFKLI
jgi:hypothetical protein